MLKKMSYPALGVILALNGLAAWLMPLNDTNFTGQLAAHRGLIWLWTLGCSALLLSQMALLAAELKLKKSVRQLPWLIELCVLLSLLFPYQPAAFPLSSALHLAFAYLFFFGISGYFLFLLNALQFYEPKAAQTIRSFYLAVCLLCAVLFMHELSITGLFEVLYTCGLAVGLTMMIQVLPRKTQKSTRSFKN